MRPCTEQATLVSADSQCELIFDEVPEVVLTRQPFLLRDNWRILDSFLELGDEVTDSPGLQRARRRAEDAGLAAAIAVVDPKILKKMEKTVEAMERLVKDGPDAPGVNQEQWEVAARNAPIYRAKYEETLVGGNLDEAALPRLKCSRKLRCCLI